MADLPAREHPSNALAASKGGLAEVSSESDEDGDEDEDEQPDNAKNLDREVDRRKDEDEKKKPPPTQFKEPESSSLLDAFGF